MKKAPMKCLALLLCAALLLSLGWIPASAKSPAKLRVALISDIHLYPEELAGGYNEAFQADQYVGRSHEQTPGTLRSALAAVKKRAARGEIDYLLITGDLTREGERLGHERLAEILRGFERETGVPVAVVPGNHDVNNGGAATFVNGVKEKVPSVTPEEFREIYAKLGYDLRGNRADFVPTGEDKQGELSYAVDLGSRYRLVAVDFRGHRVSPELRAWVVQQCRAAVKAGKTVVGMGHYNLGESFTGHLRVISDSLDNMREICEEFADAGMHFYFSGHMHLSEISPWVSDSGEVLYDIVVPGLFSYPGDYRVVNFSAAGGKIEADVRSYPVDEVLPVAANGVTYPSPYYATNLEFTFGYNGEGLRGLVKRAMEKSLYDLRKSGGIAAKVKESADFGPLNALMGYLDERLVNHPERVIGLLDGLLGEAFALPVSKLPCTRFIDEIGFGDPEKPGTVEDAGNSIITYMFWKKFDPKDDPFIQDVLRRIKNGDLIDQVLAFAVPKILDVLGEGILPLLAGVDIGLVNRALQAALGTLNLPLFLLLALIPGTKETLSATLYDFAVGAITSQSPTGSGTDARLVYDGPVKDVPTGRDTFRLPYDIGVTVGSLGRSAEITWYTKASLTSPAVKLTDKAGSPVEGVSIAYSSEPVELTAGELNLGIAQMMGYKMNAMKHTARVEGLGLFEAYRFTAGDSEFDWWAAPQLLEPTEKPVSDFFQQGQAWFSGMLKQPGTMWRNRDFYHWQ